MIDMYYKTICPERFKGCLAVFCACVLALAASVSAAAASAGISRVDITQHGAIADDHTLNTRAIQSAIDACYAQGGGTLVIPRGIFITGALSLRPGVNLELQEGAVLKGSPNLADYPVAIRRIAGAIEPHRMAMINAEFCHGLRITGPGTLDGNSRAVFAAARDFKETYRQRVQYRFPQICHIKDSYDVAVSGVYFKDAAFWNLHFYRCRDVLVENSRFVVPAEGKSPSSDGIDLDSCRDAIVRGCFFSVDDDCIALKGTRGPDATRDFASPPVENIRVSDCVFERGHGGVTLGTEATTIRGVLIERCRNTGKMPMLRIKMRPDTPGQLYENIHMRDITLDGPGLIMNARLIHGTKVPARPPESIIRNILIENVTGTYGGFGNISGNDTTRVSDITLKNIDVTLKIPAQVRPKADGAKNLRFENVRVNKEPVTEPTRDGYPTS